MRNVDSLSGHLHGSGAIAVFRKCGFPLSFQWEWSSVVQISLLTPASLHINQGFPAGGI